MEAATFNKFNYRLNWLLAIAIIALLLLWEVQRERLIALEIPRVPEVTTAQEIRKGNKEIDVHTARIIDSLGLVAKRRSDSIKVVRNSLVSLQSRARSLELLLRAEKDCDSSLLNEYISNHLIVDSTGWRLASIYEAALSVKSQELNTFKEANVRKDSIIQVSANANDSLRKHIEDQTEALVDILKKSKRKDVKTGLAFGFGIGIGVLLKQ